MLRRLHNFCAFAFQLCIQRIHIVHPDIRVERFIAPRPVGRHRLSAIDPAELDHDIVAPDHRKHRRIPEVAQYFESEDVAIVLRSLDNIANHKVRIDRLKSRFRASRSNCTRRRLRRKSPPSRSDLTKRLYTNWPRIPERNMRSKGTRLLKENPSAAFSSTSWAGQLSASTCVPPCST